jgi:hypothetical protein
MDFEPRSRSAKMPAAFYCDQVIRDGDSPVSSGCAWPKAFRDAACRKKAMMEPVRRPYGARV